MRLSFQVLRFTLVDGFGFIRHSPSVIRHSQLLIGLLTTFFGGEQL